MLRSKQRRASGWFECNVCKLDIMFVCNFIVNVDNTNVRYRDCTLHRIYRPPKKEKERERAFARYTHTSVWILYHFQFETSRQINIPLNSFERQQTLIIIATEWEQNFFYSWRATGEIRCELKKVVEQFTQSRCCFALRAIFLSTICNELKRLLRAILFIDRAVYISCLLDRFNFQWFAL